MATLNELTSDWKEVADMLLDPDMDEQAVFDTLESIEGEINDKIDGYRSIMKMLDAFSEMSKKEAERQRARRQTYENRIRRMNERMLHTLTELGTKKIDTGINTVRIQKNPARVVIDHPESIPSKYLIPQDPKVDTRAIATDLKGGELYAWAHLEQDDGIRWS